MEKPSNIGFFDKMEKVKNFGSEKMKNIGSAVSNKIAPIKRTGSNVNSKLKNMLTFNISGPFSSFLTSFILLYVLYYFLKRMLTRLEDNNKTQFIRYCIDYWFYLMIVLIIFSIILQL